MHFEHIPIEHLPVTKSGLATWVGVIATLLAVLVALLKEEIQRFWRKPILKIRAKTAPPDCNISLTTYTSPTGQHAECNSYYFRLWVYNDGTIPANNVEIFVHGLYRENTEGKFIEDLHFMPLNLVWAHTGGIYKTRIGHKLGRHCDLGHISDPKMKSVHNETRPNVPQDKTIFALALEVAPYTLMHLLEPGNYKLKLIITADNCKPKVEIVHISMSGDWFDNENEMFEKGITITME